LPFSKTNKGSTQNPISNCEEKEKVGLFAYLFERLAYHSLGTTAFFDEFFSISGVASPKFWEGPKCLILGE